MVRDVRPGDPVSSSYSPRASRAAWPAHRMDLVVHVEVAMA